VTDVAGGMPTENCYSQSNVLGTRVLNRLLNTTTTSLTRRICNKMNSEPRQDIVKYKRPYERSTMHELDYFVRICDLQTSE